MAKINTILFDFDGTVMDTNEVIMGSWQHTFRTLEGRERPVCEIMDTFGEPLAISMGRMLPQVAVDESVAVYRNYQKDNFGKLINLFPGVRELLTELKVRGYKVGLTTSRMAHTTWEGLNKYGLGAYFDVVVTCDDTDKHKPDPEPVNITLERLSSRPEESIMLGDTVYDILCARNAGVKSVLVGWSVAITEEQKNGPDGPDFYIETPEALFALLEELEK